MILLILGYFGLWALALHRMQPRHGSNGLDFGLGDVYVIFWQPRWWRSGYWTTREALFGPPPPKRFTAPPGGRYVPMADRPTRNGYSPYIETALLALSRQRVIDRFGRRGVAGQLAAEHAAEEPLE